MAYARFISSHLPPGKLRLLFLLPVLFLLPSLPWHFSTIHLRSISSFFLVWLALFKILLLSFDDHVGPLSPSLPLLTFVASASLPVNLKSPTPNSQIQSNVKFQAIRILPWAVKAALFAAIVSLYSYKDQFNSYIMLSMYCFHVYLALDLVLAVAAMATELLLPELQFEQQFNAPLLSNSLSEFWGQRWNLMVSAILRPSIYNPVSKRLGRAAGVAACFVVSGLMHELLFYYMTVAPPTGQVTAFFVLHGACVLVEKACRQAGWRRPPTVVAVPLTLGFVAATGIWLFFPPVLRNGTDERVVEECVAMLGFLERVVLFKVWNLLSCFVFLL